MRNNHGETTVGMVILGTVACIFIVVGMFFGFPVWNVWRAGLSGEAELKRAEQTRMIQIQQAKGEKESAQLRADAIAIVGKAAKDFPEYRQQEFIGAFAEALHSGKISQIIYVPTEASIPIIEAGRMIKSKKE
jgi:regulator of protease activity HflC (stomatin/prohibitin superfamily)